MSAGNGVEGLTGVDLYGNGRLDLVTANLISETLTVIPGNGDGTFQSASQAPIPSNPSSVVTCDFNGDGIPDLAMTDETRNAVLILLGRGDGTFRIDRDPLRRGAV